MSLYKMDTHRHLWYLCQWNRCREIAHILKCDKKLDLTYSEGEYFMFAIRHNNMDMLNILLKYYQKNKLQGDDNSVEYKVAKYHLIEAFRCVLCYVKLSEEMRAVISQYIPLNEESESDRDLEELIRLNDSGVNGQGENKKISDV